MIYISKKYNKLDIVINHREYLAVWYDFIFMYNNFYIIYYKTGWFFF